MQYASISEGPWGFICSELEGALKSWPIELSPQISSHAIGAISNFHSIGRRVDSASPLGVVRNGIEAHGTLKDALLGFSIGSWTGYKAGSIPGGCAVISSECHPSH